MAGQHWTVNVPGNMGSPPSHDTVRVVAIDANNPTLHVESPPLRFHNGPVRGTTSQRADVVYEHGIVRDLHQVVVQRMDLGPGARRVDARSDRRVRLVSHTEP